MFKQKLPKGITLSLNYNDSNSFRPSQVGTDIYGKQLPSPSGKTKDYGFLVTALDNKVSLRMTWYKTSQATTTLSDPFGMKGWVAGGVVRTMNALMQETQNGWNDSQTTRELLVNKWFFGSTYDQAIANQALPADWRNQLSTLVNQPLRIRHAAVDGDPTYTPEGAINPSTMQPYLAPPLTADEIEYRRAWFAARTDAQWFRPLDQAWAPLQGFNKVQDGNRFYWNGSSPGTLTLSNDLVSKGTEIELTANPTRNWRMTFNAAQVSAVRDNILPDWTAFIAKNKDFWLEGFNNNAGGTDQLNYWKQDGIADVRHWGGTINYSPEIDTFGGRMLASVYGPYVNALAGTGRAVSELRKWRYNFVTNYSFSEGRFKNVNVGGAVRWQDKTAIGYLPKYNSDAGIWATDVDNPIYGPSEANYDVWIGYRHKLNNRVTWEIQLNVRDLFSSDELIPISANPDGTVAQVRIPSQTTWQLTNTFKF